MKGPRTFLEFLNLSKLPIKNIETLSQSWNMKETFSSSQNMTEYMCSGRKLLGEQDFSEESGLGQLLRNAYKRESKHQKEGPTFKHSKPMQEHFNISLNFLQVH